MAWLARQQYLLATLLVGLLTVNGKPCEKLGQPFLCGMKEASQMTSVDQCISIECNSLFCSWSNILVLKPVNKEASKGFLFRGKKFLCISAHLKNKKDGLNFTHFQSYTLLSITCRQSKIAKDKLF